MAKRIVYQKQTKCIKKLTWLDRCQTYTRRPRKSAYLREVK